MTAMRIPFLSLKPGEDAAAVDAAVRRVIERGWYVLGPEVEAFERAFADASGAAYSVGVGTGTDALVLILKALGIGRGDEVITTPVSARRNKRSSSKIVLSMWLMMERDMSAPCARRNSAISCG